MNDTRMPITAPETNDPQRAGLARRLGAMFYDSLLVFAVGWSVTAAVIGLRVWLNGAEQLQAAGGRAATGPLLQLPLFAAVTLFFVWF